MNRRTVMLLVGAGLVVLLYAVDSGYRSWIEEPTQQYQGKLTSLQKELTDLNAEQVAGRRLANRLDDYAERALPHDPELARSRYQAWLLGLLESHGFQGAAVDADSPQPIEVRGRLDRKRRRNVGYSIRYTVRARTSLQQLVDFMYDFQHSGQLHKIRSISLNPQGLGDQLNLNLTIETLALEATERSDQLSDLVRDDTSLGARRDFETLVRRNVFARGFSQSLGQIRLTAITRNRGGQLEAWFAVGTPAKTQILMTGQQLELSLHEVRVMAIETDTVQLAVNGADVWIPLGSTLKDILQPTTSPSDVREDLAKDMKR